MKFNLRRVLFTAGLVAILVAISIICLIFGRGHTIYLDNKSIEGTEYTSYASVDIIYKGEKVVNLEKAERGSITLTGQKLDVQLVAKKTNSAAAQTVDISIDLPYDLDGIVINIPAYLAGADADTYMSEFVSTRVEENTSEDVQLDEFGMSADE